MANLSAAWLIVAQARPAAVLCRNQVEFRSLAVRFWAMTDSVARFFAPEDLRFRPALGF
jgi:hypothetical protein